jgi:hypothetical protein
MYTTYPLDRQRINEIGGASTTDYQAFFEAQETMTAHAYNSSSKDEEPRQISVNYHKRGSQEKLDEVFELQIVVWEMEPPVITWDHYLRRLYPSTTQNRQWGEKNEKSR